MLIRAMRERDLDRVLEIAQDLPQAPRWDRAVYETALSPASAPRRVALVVEEDGAGVVGFAVASVVLPEAELETIGLAAPWQRLGFGGQLLQAICRRLSEMGVTKVMLEVRESNGAAQRLYRSHGFAEAGRRASYYADPKEDAIVMNLSVAQTGSC